MSLLPPPCEELTTSEPLRQRDARQAAGDDDDLLAVQDERPQVDVPAFETVAVDKASDARESEIIGCAM